MATISLSEEQADLLKTFAEAYSTPDPGSGQKDSLFFTTTFQAGTIVKHHAMPGALVVTMGDLEDFADYGLIRISYGDRMTSGTFTVTPQGFEAVEQIEKRERALSRASTPPADAPQIGLDWNEEALPVLRAVNDIWSPDGASQDAINLALDREQGNPQTSLVLRKLEEAGYIRGTADIQEVEGPLICEPTAKALELLAGWPSEGSAALQQFMAALEKKIEETDDEEERSKLQRLRKSAQDVGERVMTGVIADVVKSQL